MERLPQLLATLADVGSSAGRCEEALFSVANAAREGGPSSSSLLTLGAPALILRSMARHAGDAGVAEQGCYALWSMARERSGLVAGAASAVLNAMARHDGHLGVVEKGCSALASLALDEGFRVEMMRWRGGEGSAGSAAGENNKNIGMVEIVLRAMTRFEKHDVLCEQACMALGNVARDGVDFQVELLAKGVPAAIIASMALPRQNVGVCLSGVMTLCSLSSPTQNRLQLLKIGVDRVIEEAMRDYPGVHQLQIVGDETLVNLGKVEKLIERSELSYYYALGTLEDTIKDSQNENLVLVSDFIIELAETEETRDSLVKDGATEILLLGFREKTKQKDSTVMESLLKVLRAIIPSPIFQPLKEVGEAVLNVMEVLHLSPRISKLGIEILMMDRFFIPDLVRDAATIIVRIVKDNEQKELQKLGCQAIIQFSKKEEDRQDLISSGVLEILILGAANAHDDLDYLERTLETAVYLSRYEEGVAALTSTEGSCVPMLTKIMTAHLDRLGVQMSAISLVSNLVKSSTFCEDLVDSDFIEVIVKAMEKHEEIQKVGLLVLKTLARENKKTLERLSSLNVIDMLCKVASGSTTTVVDEEDSLPEPYFLPLLSPASSLVPDTTAMRKLFDQLSDLKTIEEINGQDVDYYNLRLLLEHHRSMMLQQSHFVNRETRSAVESGETVSEVPMDLGGLEKKIRNGEAYLGTELLTSESGSTKPEWQTEAENRDKARSELVQKIKEIRSASGRLHEIYESASRPSQTILDVEDAMLKRLEQQKSKQLVKILPPETFESKKRDSEAASSSSASQSEKQDWFIEFRRIQLDKIAKSREEVAKNISNLQELVRITSESVQSLGELLTETHHQLLEPNIETLWHDVGVAKEERSKKSKKYEDQSRELQGSNGLSFPFDVEKECELHNRRVALGKIIDQLFLLAGEIKSEQKSLKKIELSELEDDTLLEHEQEHLQGRKREINDKILQLQREREELQKKVVSFSRCTSVSSFSENGTASSNGDAEDRFDFPEAPLIALLAGDPNKSAVSKSFSKTRAVTQILQKSGFLAERSLHKDYETDNLPDEAMEIIQSPEVQHSSIVIARLKGIQNLTNLGSIKVLQPIELTEFKTIRAAVLLASRARHSSILPIETVFVDEDKGKVFIQTPFRVGGSMKRWLERSPRPTERKLEVLSKAADALDAIHEHGVVHRDIKLENIVMDSNEDTATPAICDFDTSRDTTGAFVTTMAGNHGKGKVGTLRYMAPEIFDESSKASKESDVWSFVMLCLVALVYDGKYDSMPMLRGVHVNGRVDIQKALDDAQRKLTQPSQKSLLDLFFNVLGTLEKEKRPSMNQIRALLINADLRECLLCGAEASTSSLYRRIEGCECSAGHFFCRKHFREMVATSVENGEVRCMECGNEHPVLFSEKIIFECAGSESLSALLKGREERFKRDLKSRLQGARAEGEHKGKEEALKEAEVLGLLGIRVSQIRLKIESIALPQCPRCKVAIQHADGCAAMKCTNCGCGFCMFCLTDCGSDAHHHVRSCEHRPDFGDVTTDWGSPEESRFALRKKLKHDLEAYWSTLEADIKPEAAKDAAIKGWFEYYQIPL